MKKSSSAPNAQVSSRNTQATVTGVSESKQKPKTASPGRFLLSGGSTNSFRRSTMVAQASGSGVSNQYRPSPDLTSLAHTLGTWRSQFGQGSLNLSPSFLACS